MTDMQNLKALAKATQAAFNNLCEHGGDELADAWDSAELAYDDAANPAVVLGLIAEIERLQNFEVTYKEFSDKTDWVQETAHWSELGMHRADVLRKRVDQLKAENEALRAEAAKWKNESVSDSQTIYSLSCNLAQRTGEVRELAGVVDDLSALTKRFVQRLRKAAPGNDLPEKALDYLKRKGLQGSAMREIVEGRLS